MVGPIRPTGVTGASAIRRAAGASSGNRTGGALRKLAGKVAGRVAREFRLLGKGEDASDDRPDHYREGEDLYDITATASELASELNARPLDEGILARSLDGFVQESAALLAARPGAASLDAIARVIMENEGSREGETLDVSVQQIDQTTRGIAKASPGPASIRRPR
ncbi:MAG: hypothetical protein AAF291_10480 [Pseudomonadota bacterium]